MAPGAPGSFLVGQDWLLNEAPPAVKLFRVGALRDSDANRFYQRHGFVQVSESEWEMAYERPHTPGPG